VAIVHDAVKETINAHLTLVHVFHAYASADTPWVTHALSHYTYVAYASVHFKCLFIRTQPTQTLNDTGGGYHHGALNFRSVHSPSFPSSILHFPLIAPPGLQLC
jgi:hypothetical protein